MPKKALLGFVAILAAIFAATVAGIPAEGVRQEAPVNGWVITSTGQIAGTACRLTVSSWGDLYGVRASVAVTNAGTGWHILQWGDGQNVGHQAQTGETNYTHVYQDMGVKSITYTTDVVDGSKPSCVVWVSFELTDTTPTVGQYKLYLPFVVRPSPSAPVCSIQNLVGPTPHDFLTTLQWEGAGESWHLFYWGDEQMTGKGPVGFFGSSGSQSWTHIYDPGIYTQTTTLSGLGGPGSCRQRVQVP